MAGAGREYSTHQESGQRPDRCGKLQIFQRHRPDCIIQRPKAPQQESQGDQQNQKTEKSSGAPRQNHAGNYTQARFPFVR